MLPGMNLIKFAGIGARVAWSRVFGGDDTLRVLHETLGRIPGAPAKIGQLMGMRAGQSTAVPDPMPLEQVKAILIGQCPRLVESIDAISPWCRAASIGQTHQVRLNNGRLVAAKIQYPGVAKALTEQLDAMFRVAAFSPARHYAFDLTQTKNFLLQKLLEEIDYLREMDVQRRFFDYYRLSQVIVPEVYPQLGVSSVLVQSWEDCESLYSVSQSWSRQLRDKAGEVMTEFLLSSFTGLGVMHTDLNPGNFGFRLEGERVLLVLYDFGSTFEIAESIVLDFYRWLLATRNGDEMAVRSAMERLGFSPLHLRHIATKILPLSEVLLAPLIKQGHWNARTWRLQEQMNDILGQDKWWFRTAGPPWFLYFMRSFQGWYHGMTILDATVDVGQLWAPRERLLIKKLVVGAGNGELRSTVLRVQVTEEGETIVDVTLPARAIENLAELVPDTVQQKCLQDGLDLAALGARIMKEGGAPQDVFLTRIGRRHYHVWLS